MARGPSSVRYVCTRREETCVESARPRRRCGRPRDTASLLSILSRRGERADTALNPELQEEVQVPARAQTGARSSSPPCAPDFGGAGRFCLSTRRPDPRGPGRECAGVPAQVPGATFPHLRISDPPPYSLL